MCGVGGQGWVLIKSWVSMTSKQESHAAICVPHANLERRTIKGILMDNKGRIRTINGILRDVLRGVLRGVLRDD